MGPTDLAWDEKQGREVVLRMMPPHVLPASGRAASFLLHMELLRRFQPAGLVAILAYGWTEGWGYVAFEFMAGGSLGERWTGSPPTPREAASMVKHVADSVQGIHAKHIVHQRLDPRRILLDLEGAPRVAGLGWGGSGNFDPHRAWLPAAPSQYTAPEVAESRSREVGPRSDVYSLGGLLHLGLFRSAPGPRAALEIPAFARRSAVSRDLSAICARCLERAPADRYADAGALADDLARFLEGKRVVARTIGRWRRLARRIGRSSWLGSTP